MDNVDFVLKRLGWIQQDLFEMEGLVADAINLADMSADDINKLSVKSKYRRELIIRDFAEFKGDLMDLLKFYDHSIQEILEEVKHEDD